MRTFGTNGHHMCHCQWKQFYVPKGRTHFLLLSAKFCFELKQRIPQRWSQKVFVCCNEVVLFSLEQTINDIIN